MPPPGIAARVFSRLHKVLVRVPVENAIGAAWRPFADSSALTVQGDERVGGVSHQGGMSMRYSLVPLWLRGVHGYPPRRGYAARRSYRWWRPPICGSATTRPADGRATGRGRGVSFSSAKCVRDAV